MTRRELLTAAVGPPTAAATKTAPTAPVNIAQVTNQGNLTRVIAGMFEQIGGTGWLLKKKTNAIKLNPTGAPSTRFQGQALGVTYYSHPQTIRPVERPRGTAGPLGEYLLDSGRSGRQLKSVSANLVFENTNALGTCEKYAPLTVPQGGYVFPGFDLKQESYETDVFMSMAKLKNRPTCGVTLSMKKCFGNTPASIYGDAAGVREPNESPTRWRLNLCHVDKCQPSTCSPSGLDAQWVSGLQLVNQRVLLRRANSVTTNAVGTAVPGCDPQASRGTAAFEYSDDHLKLAEGLAVGRCDLKRIEAAGASIAEVKLQFPRLKAKG